MMLTRNGYQCHQMVINTSDYQHLYS